MDFIITIKFCGATPTFTAATIILFCGSAEVEQQAKILIWVRA